MRHEKARNMLQLALEMQASRQGVSLADIEERFGVGRRTAMRMRDAVVCVFPQVEEIAGDDRAKRWRIPKSSVNGLIDVSVEELAALESAARLMQQQNRAVEAAELAGLVAKLKAMMRPDAVRRAEPDLDALLESEGLAMRPGPRPRIGMGVVTILREAIKSCRKVRIGYRNRKTRQTNERIVHPYGFLHGHRHYLVAWHEHPKAEKFVLFSLPGIETVELSAESFVRDSAFNLQSFAARSFGLFQEEPFDVVWRFSPDAADVAADFVFHPTQTLERQEDGSLIVRFRAGGDLEMAWHLCIWGDKVEVLEPARLAELANGQRRAWPALP
ncbi:putative DNA-binding transcriptional regulator YafY [Azospirillum agricola]|uniref:helix-turn-helix transcriptional regulator n=1 Tax=Azospirillum agricola TaxID=1720247 RepID=UPI001AEB5546|nr:WYL domain-containing protein [Azospirillum agricola]MBP2230412.1 putative DNA-binding transcriptional regulator YafY [Azospirillum agricola]